MSVVIIALLLGSIVYFSRRAKTQHTVVVPAERESEEWVFDVRDMNGQLRKKQSKKEVDYCELRRVSSRRWEMACEETPEGPVWTVMPEPLLSAVETTYARYNGGVSDPEGPDAGGGPYRS